MHSHRLGFIALALSCWAGTATAQLTPAEESADAPRYSQHEDITRFLSVLRHASRQLAVRVIGRTAGADIYPAKDLYLVVLSGNGALEPAELDRTKVTVLLTASQHGNEQSAKEAALRLVRDLAVADLAPLLQKANVLVIPQCNPYGNWVDQRDNETGLDMNRDHLKLELSRGTVLTDVREALSKQGVTFFEYLVTQEMGLDSSAGVRYRSQEPAGRPRMTRFSTT